MIDYSLLRNLAFKFDPETAHHLFSTLYQKAPFLISPFFKPIELSNKYQVNSKNLNWNFPVGLAAGFDKDGLVTLPLAQMGFGSIEVGTVTPEPQMGNPKPRIFRLPEDKSLRNSMGFPGSGMNEVLKRIEKFNNRNFSLGINLGKNKLTPDEEAYKDYEILYEKFAPFSDYLVINLSSPNTPGLRDLQKSESLEIILNAVKRPRDLLNKPLFLKISPDINFKDIDDILKLANKFALSGIIATNTTIIPELGKGGVSGNLLKEKASFLRKELLKKMKDYPEMDLIGVGGIDSFDDLKQFWDAGGKFAQIYTSFIYQGTNILFEIQKGIDDLLKKNNCQNLNEYFSKRVLP